MTKVFFTTKKYNGIKLDVLVSKKGVRNIFLNRYNSQINSPDFERVAENDPAMLNLFDQLDEYFKGERREFNLQLEIIGTDFQKKVWSELLKIKYGKTITYRDLAIRLGNIKSLRAVGRANGANPLPIVIPCHRVIGSNGKLVGYGGGLDVKRRLLELEGSFSPGLFS